MCGIVGYVGQRDAAPVLLPALRRLEYRGYDSAGIATVADGRLVVRKTPGKIATLQASIAAGGPAPAGRLGVAHTRWATHGRPTDANAHPHVDCDHRVAIVHNGIIENYRELRRRLSGEGHRFRSQTDTEVVSHLLEHHRRDGLADGIRQAAQRLEGAYAIAAIAADEPELLVAARRGSSPLVIGYGEGEIFLASDISALLRETRQVVVVGDGEIAVIGPTDVRLSRMDGVPVRRPRVTVSWDAEAAEKGGYPHFMLKEIFGQPEVIRSTIRDRVDANTGEVRVPELGLKDRDIAGLNRLCFVGCGTSWHAALVGKHLVEELARLPVEVDLASEFRYRHPILDGRALTVPISQSGETADTLAALRCARELGSRTVAICNVVDSALAREADGVLYTRAGLEIGVASTKAFTAQLAAVTLLAIRLGQARGLAEPELIDRTVKALCEVPDLMAAVLEQSGQVRAVAERLAGSRSCLYLGRGLHHPLALEGALKLKEISYIHAEGFAAGEMKHGPIALIDRDTPLVALAPRAPTYEKMAANIEEAKARDGIVIAIATDGDEGVAAKADVAITVPAALYWVQPLLLALPLQLLAYHAGVLRGADVDQPRHLAKSVTVE